MVNNFKSMNAVRKTEDGFTLIELLVVIVIIGVLAAIALPIFTNQQKAAGDAALKSDIRTVALAQQTYITKNPSDQGTISLVELKKLAPALSSNTIIGTWVTVGKGYCVAGKNSGGTADGETTDSVNGKYFWYDSALGGFMKGATTGTPPAGGACQGYPTRPPGAWYYGSESPSAPAAGTGWYY